MHPTRNKCRSSESDDHLSVSTVIFRSTHVLRALHVTKVEILPISQSLSKLCNQTIAQEFDTCYRLKA